jgi:hypothetical protein
MLAAKPKSSELRKFQGSLFCFPGFVFPVLFSLSNFNGTKILGIAGIPSVPLDISVGFDLDQHVG